MDQLRILKGKVISKIGRLGATGNFSFLSADGKEYWLRVETGFRFRTGERTLIGNLDMFEPADTMRSSPSFDWDTFEWDVKGFNRYDEWAVKFLKEHQGRTTVREITVNNFGDLALTFDDGTMLEVFLNAAHEECWRFFEHDDPEHLVMMGEGLEKG